MLYMITLEYRYSFYNKVGSNFKKIIYFENDIFKILKKFWLYCKVCEI